MAETANILDEREKTHGDYTAKCRVIRQLKNIVHSESGWDRLTDVQKESADMILHKLGRILTGNPHHKDHWSDIAGYAELAAREL